MSNVIWKAVGDELKAFALNHRGEEVEVAWAPQPGSQQAFYECPLFEVLYSGTRGPGKTDAMIMDFARHCGPERFDHNGTKVAGWGSDWRGVLFRQNYPDLSDVVAKTKKWFPRIWPGLVNFNEQKMTWTWNTGEELLLRHMAKEEDYNKYHGHAYPWIGWEELTTWADDVCYKLMMSCSRSTIRGMPRKYRATTNPYGVGHNWVQARFMCQSRKHPDILGKVVDFQSGDDGKKLQRVVIHGYLCENKILLHADPGYEARIRESARNPAELAAWIDGSWDIVAGGMFDDVWDASVHVVRNFEVPKSWTVERAYDWGSSKPFSVGWWARSDGTKVRIGDRDVFTTRGDLFRVGEWYGWNGNPNQGLRLTDSEIAKEIIKREETYWPGRQVIPGPADEQIWSKVNNVSTAEIMESHGCYFVRSDKSSGSRSQGWQRIRDMMKQSLNPRREEPGMFVTEDCHQFIRTVPRLPRSIKDPDDVNTDAEDHVGDETRYVALTRDQHMGIVSIAGR